MMVQRTKRINGKYLANFRKESGHTQESFATFCDVGLRTIQNAEYGKPLAYNNYEKIINGIIEASQLAKTHTDADLIKRDLQPYQKTQSSAGIIESDYHLVDLNQVDPVVPEYSPHVTNRLTGENRFLAEDDFIFLLKFAHDVSSQDSYFDKFCKSIKSKEKIWHSNCEIDDREVVLALDYLDKAMSNFKEPKISRSLNELTSQMANVWELKDALSKLNDLDYQVFLGSQETYSSQVPIFIIDNYNIRRVSYQVKCLHPIYADNMSDFPYYSLEGGLIGTRNYPLKFTKMPYVYADDLNNRPTDEDGNPIGYPSSPDEKMWSDICNMVEKQYTHSEQGLYDAYCKQWLKSNKQ